MNKEIIAAVKEGINYILIVAELSEIVREKEQAVRCQDFELAVKIREKENQVRLLLPSAAALGAVRDLLNKSIETNE